MIGLLRNNFYGMLGNIKLLLAFFIVFGGALLITGNETLLSSFTLLAGPTFALLSFSCLRKETASKWNKYKLSLPVKRKDIIKSQFLSHLAWTIFGVLMAAAIMALTVLIHGNKFFYYGARDAITLLIGSGVLALFIGAISYPMFYLWDAEGSEAIIAISVIVSIGITMGLSWVINVMNGFSNQITDVKYYISLIFILAVAIVTFILSFILTVVIFKIKEY